jgi:methyl-accepting chemotaxis protein
MQAFNNLKVGLKLLISFATMILLMAAIGTVGFFSMRMIKTQLDNVFLVRLPAVDYLIEADRDLQQLLVAERSMIFTNVKSDEFGVLVKDYYENLEQVKTRWGKYKALASAPEELEVIPAFEKDLAAWEQVSKRVVENRQADTSVGRSEAIALTRGEASERFETMRDHINKLTEINLAIGDKANQAAQDMYKKTNMILIVVILIGMVIGVVFTRIISQGLAKPINRLVGFAEELRLGNLNADLNVGAGEENRVDEIGRLIKSMEKVRESLSAKALVAEKIAEGELSTHVDVLSDKDVLGKSLSVMVENLNKVAREINAVALGVGEGDLSSRGKSDAFKGGWQELIDNINGLIEEFIRPITMTSQNIDRLSKGDIPEQIKEEYKGDYNEIKNNLNTLIDATHQVTHISQQISKGNLEVDVNMRSEKDRLMEALGAMVRKLTSIVYNVQTAARQVAVGSQEISSSSMKMSQGATEQASSVEEVSSSMEQMNSTVQQNADNAGATASIAIQASSDAEEGGRAVTETVSAMKTISTKIGIIEEIARQTNMLALNAAIEAARAGEHGKGFAVVASEVRKLAERSQKAAKEISNYSTSSVEISEKAGELLENIVPNIKKTSELVQEISSASIEQADGIRQVSISVDQLNQIIQDYASVSEEMAATSEELSAQASQLNDVISFFKVAQQAGNAVMDTDEDRPVAMITNVERKQKKDAPHQKTSMGSSKQDGVFLVMDTDKDDEFETY